MKNFNYLSLMTVLMLGSSACSMKDRTEVHSVSVQLPQVWSNGSTQSISNHSSNMSISYATPTNLASFQCYGLNVTGPGINSDPRMGCTDPASGMGMLAGFVPVSSGRIEMMVPAGGNRKVELIGIQSDVGCPILDALLASGGTQALQDLGEPYLLGSTVTDIFDDTAVTIVASFNANSKAFQGCGDHGGNEQSLRLQVTGNSPSIQKAHCSPFGVFASGQGPYPSVQPTILSQPSSSGTVTLYTDNACTNAVSAYSSFSGQSNYIQYYIKTSPTAAGNFSAQVTTTATGWTAPPVTFAIVPDRLTAVATPTPAINTCASIVVSAFGSVSPVTMGTIDVEVHNNTQGSNGSQSSMEIYTSAGCMTGLLTGTYSNGSTHYTLGNIGTTTTTIYVKSTVGEVDSIGFVRNDQSAEPVQVSVTFMPFQLSTFTGSMKAGPAMTTIPGFTIPFSFGDAAITGVKIGGIPCGSIAHSAGIVTCTIPPTLSPGNSPIYLVVGSSEFYSGHDFTFGSSPVFIGGATAYQANCVVPNKCTYAGGTYTITTLGTPVNVMPMMTGVALQSCSVSPTLPGGLSLSTNCTIQGTAPSSSVTTNYTITAVPMGNYYIPVTTTISLDVQ